ncbi:MAG TPA: M28 family peptidase [Bacteroidota bacterium]|nr:M28 family peptidase [Bacteroidota bacterium]
MARTLILFSFVIILVVGCGPSDLDVAIQQITADELRKHIAELASDRMEGRAPATRGDSLATEYIVAQYKAIGLEPAGENGTYLQKVPIIGTKLLPGSSIQIKHGGRTIPLHVSNEAVIMSGYHQTNVTLKESDLIFVGYGIDAPEQNWDDYKGVDVKGKVLLMLNNDPPSDDPKFFGGKARTYYGRWTYKYEIAAKKGAAGAIIIHTNESAGYPYQVVQNSWGRERFDLDAEDPAGRIVLKGWTTEEATKKYLTMAGFDLAKLIKDAGSRDFKPVPLRLKVSASMKFTVRRLTTNNIIGKLTGSDSALSKQYVIFSAHYDHLGIGKPVNGDSINNGALDNASGTSMMLTLAKAFATMTTKPKRSLLFVAVAAEEYGLLGSQFYAQNPTVPVASMAANMNIDGINIWGKTNDITFLGWDRSSLGAEVDAVAREMKMVVKPDAYPEQGYFYRSDHFNFAKVGVPVLYLDTGTDFIGKPGSFAKEMVDLYNEKHYHQPSDELRDDWNFEGAIQQAEFVLRVVKRIADNPAMPTWNKGDEFEAARLRVLAEAKKE